MKETYHILIVEDDTGIRDGIEIYLKTQDYQVFKAKDGIEGLEIIRDQKIHLAIIDVMMPRMDGIRMVEELRKEYDFPVIMLSAKCLMKSSSSTSARNSLCSIGAPSSSIICKEYWKGNC